MSSRRVAYADAGAAMRQAIDRALAAELGPRQWRTFAVVLKLTASYSKLEDRTFLAAIAEAVFATEDPARWQMNRIAEDLNDLAVAGVIEREPPRRGRPKKAAGGARYRIAIPPAVMHPPAGALPAGKAPHGRHEKPPRPTRNAPAGRGPTEESSEKSPGEGPGEAHADRPDTPAAAPGPPPPDGDAIGSPMALVDRVAALVDRDGATAGAWAADLELDHGQAVALAVVEAVEARHSARGARWAFPSELRPIWQDAAARTVDALDDNPATAGPDEADEADAIWTFAGLPERVVAAGEAFDGDETEIWAARSTSFAREAAARGWQTYVLEAYTDERGTMPATLQVDTRPARQMTTEEQDELWRIAEEALAWAAGDGPYPPWLDTPLCSFPSLRGIEDDDQPDHEQGAAAVDSPTVPPDPPPAVELDALDDDLDDDDDPIWRALEWANDQAQKVGTPEASEWFLNFADRLFALEEELTG